MHGAESRREPSAREKIRINGSSRKVGGANKGLGEAPKSCTRKEHESATNSIAKRGQGAIAPCRVKGQRPLWGLGQRPNCSAGDQYAKGAQQRCRQRSVPASNFARPQTRPQAALPPRFREEPIMFNCAICLHIGAFSFENSIKHGRMRGKNSAFARFNHCSL